MRVSGKSRSVLVPLAITVLMVSVMFMLRLALSPVLGERQPYVFFYVAVAFAVWNNGWRAAVLAWALSALLANYFFVPPFHQLGFASAGEFVGLLSFSAVSMVIVGMGTLSRQRRARAEAAVEQLRRSESQFRASFELTSVGKVQADARTRRFIRMNQRFREICGYSEAELLQRTFSEITHPDDRARDEAMFVRLVAGQISEYAVEKRYVRKDGAIVWVNVNVAMVRAPDGDPLYTVGVVQDITTRKTAEASAEKAQRELRLALEAARFGICEWRLEDDRLVWSREHFELLGYEPFAFEPRFEHFRARIHPDDLAAVDAEFARAKQQGAPTDVEYRAVLPGGEIRWINARGRFHYTPEGEAISMNWLIMDITQRKTTELALREAQELVTQEARHLEKLVADRTARLEESLRAVEALCYTIAHDLRAPLRAMQGFARALADDYSGSLDDIGRDYAQRIVRAAVRMDVLITDLLAYGRLGSGDGASHAIELDTVIDGFLTDYAEEIQQRHATICVERLLPIVVANRTMIEQVVANLLLNAMKFVASDVQPRIRVFAERTDGFVRLCVEDNGIGIPPEHGRKLFQVFQRLHPQQEYPGTGIGLAMVKKAVERMNGRVGFDSVPGKGSTFWVELPAATAGEPSAKRAGPGPSGTGDAFAEHGAGV